MRKILFLGVLLLSGIGAGWSSPAAAQNLFGSFQRNTNYTGSYGCSGNTRFDSPGSYQPGSTMEFGCASGAGQASTIDMQARARADYGTLGLSTAAELLNSGGYPWSTVARIDGYTSWGDTVQLASGELSNGAPIAFRLTAIIDIAGAGHQAGPLFGAGSELSFSMYAFGRSLGTACFSDGLDTLGVPYIDGACRSAQQLSLGRNILTFEGFGFNGQSSQLDANLQVSSWIYSPSPYEGLYSTHLDALGTAHTYLTVLTPGATLTSASGHDYSLPAVAAVPEPASWTMMIAGFGLVGGAMRNTRGRRRRTATAGTSLNLNTGE